MTGKGETSISDALDALTDHRAVRWLRDQYHIPALVLVFVFMLAVRLQRYGRFVTDDKIRFSGNDPWYHYRQVSYTVKNWPQTMPFDPWTGYPVGADVGQFGSLFDQILATIALIVGLGSPSDHTVRLVMVLAPPVIGALTAIPVYLVAKRLHSRLAGVTAAAMLALIPGVFLNRALVGTADHNIAEPLFMLAALATLLWALDRARDNAVVFEAVREADIDLLKAALGPSALAGAAIAMYIWVWPPGVFFVAILALFVAVYASDAVLQNRTPEPVLLAVAVAGTTTGLLSLVKLDTMTFNTTLIGPLHFLFAFGLAGGALALAGFARLIDQSDVTRFAYPATLAVASGVGVAALSLLAPDLFHFIYQNVMRVVGFGQHANTLTIGEAQPFLARASLMQAVMSEYGMLFFVAVFGGLMLAATLWFNGLNGEDSAHEVLLLTWSAILLMAAFTQVRFNYYLAPAVAILAAYGLITVLEALNIPENVPRLETYQWMALIMVVLLVFVPVLVYPFSANAVSRGQNHGVGEYQAWEGSLEWMNDNTAEYESLDYYGTYEETDNFQYGNDVYGVMSWWDYGHWTTVTAERIPVANPFQQHAQKSAEFLLAQNESEANDVLASMGNETNVRYVMVDWKMVTPGSKFGAPVVWHPGLNQSDIYEYMYVQREDGRLGYAFSGLKQRYYESLMVRLYHYHGSAARPAPVVVDYETSQVQGSDGGQYSLHTVPTNDMGVPQTAIKQFNTTREAQTYLQNDSTAHLGGVGKQPREFVPALKHYRLVKTSRYSVFESRGYMQYPQSHAQYGNVRYSDFIGNPAWVKTFERVPGATVTGTGAPANATVMAEVPMHDPTQNSTFTYRQFTTADENGNFTFTLPYSTTGYDEVSRDAGYANTSVRATGPYQFVSFQQRLVVEGSGENQTKSLSYEVWTGSQNVTEAQVIGADDSPVEVTLEKRQPPNSSESDDQSDK